MIGVQLEVIHWGFGDLNITVEGSNPASGEINTVEGIGRMPLAEGIGRVAKVSSAGGVGNVRGSGRNKRTGGSGGTCG